MMARYAKERLALGKHAQIAGCKIIVNPSLGFERFGLQARLIRLNTLKRFLMEMPNDRCRVAFNREMHHSESVTLLRHVPGRAVPLSPTVQTGCHHSNRKRRSYPVVLPGEWLRASESLFGPFQSRSCGLFFLNL
ncbi:MAG: hypothetical protein AB9869_36160 [Verrucomicrobiia bacterium]